MEQTSDQDSSCNDDENSNDTESDDCDEIEPPSKRASTWSSFSSEQNSSFKTENKESQASTATIVSKHPLAPIDPAKVAKKIKDILSFANIPQRLFAKEVMGISRSALVIMLNPRKGKQWAECTSEMKRRYHIIHEWSQAPEKSIEHLKAVGIRDNSDKNIDTVMLAKAIKIALKDAKISQELFGKEVLGISKNKIFNVLHHPPKSWIKSTGSIRQIFKKMHEWIESPKESIEHLKAMSIKTSGGDEVIESDYVEDEELLDTLELVYKANKLLKNFKISKAEFSQILGIHLGAIRQLFENPAPWHLLTKLKKDYYLKIHEWLVENKGVEGDLHNSTSEEEGDEEIDSFKVSREIIQLLRTHGIAHTFFAIQKIRISSVYFGELVTNTKPWTDLHKSQRNIFKILKKWTLAKSEEIKALEREYQVYRARRSINSRNKNLRKKKALDQ
jgi:hypothetical protein